MLNYLSRIGLSLLLSALIGSEREFNDKPAGLRTCMLVCLGATLFTIISISLREVGMRYDLGRIIAYCIVGIGFLGSGVIIQNKGSIEGVTTAGVLWALVSIGILVGLNYYVLAIISALCIYGILIMPYLITKLRGLIKNEKEKKKPC